MPTDPGFILAAFLLGLIVGALATVGIAVWLIRRMDRWADSPDKLLMGAATDLEAAARIMKPKAPVLHLADRRGIPPEIP